MARRSKLVAAGCVAAVALLQSGCGASIPYEPVPPGWALDVHQPGEWWTQPLIPRAVVVQRCPPPPGWASDPDLRVLTSLQPGTSVEYSNWTDDYHCDIGWSEPVSTVEFTVDEMATEEGLRRICSSSGLPLDASWRFVGVGPTQHVGEPPEEAHLEAVDLATAAFQDDQGTVVSCMVAHAGDASSGAFVELSAGTDATPGAQACPVALRDMARENDGTLAEYQLRGAVAVRGEDGRVLTDAATLEIGVAGDSVTTSHPVVDGIAIVGAWVKPEAAVPLDWDSPPPVEGRVLDAGGNLLATCGG